MSIVPTRRRDSRKFFRAENEYDTRHNKRMRYQDDIFSMGGPDPDRSGQVTRESESQVDGDAGIKPSVSSRYIGIRRLPPNRNIFLVIGITIETVSYTHLTLPTN